MEERETRGRERDLTKKNAIPVVLVVLFSGNMLRATAEAHESPDSTLYVCVNLKIMLEKRDLRKFPKYCSDRSRKKCVPNIA